MTPRVVVIATGGTIAMRHDAAAGGARPALSGAELVAEVRRRTALPLVRIAEFERITANHFTPEVWVRLAHRIRSELAVRFTSGAVVTHGTDAIEETAFFLDLVHAGPKPVIVTGSMRTSDSAHWDGARNLADAVVAAASRKARGLGVLVAFRGRLWAAREVVKRHSTGVDAFHAAGRAPVGTIRRGRVQIARHLARRRPLSARVGGAVEIVTHAIGSDPSVVDHHLRRRVAGLVIQAAGAGNVSGRLADAIARARRRRIPVAVATRVGQGGTEPLYAFHGGGASLARGGALLTSLTPHKARVALLLAIGNRLGTRACARLLGR